MSKVENWYISQDIDKCIRDVYFYYCSVWWLSLSTLAFRHTHGVSEGRSCVSWTREKRNAIRVKKNQTTKTKTKQRQQQIKKKKETPPPPPKKKQQQKTSDETWETGGIRQDGRLCGRDKLQGAPSSSSSAFPSYISGVHPTIQVFLAIQPLRF